MGLNRLSHGVPVSPLSSKQDKLTGQPGQVVGFGVSGEAVPVQGWSNPNLLDNWYFVDPIDQRHGYVVPAGTTYYTDSNLTEEAGTTASAVKVLSATGAQQITVSGSTFYVSGSDATRGYTQMGYSIDRWRFENRLGEGVLEIKEHGVQFSRGSSDYASLIQRFETVPGWEKAVFSVLCDDGLYTTRPLTPEKEPDPVACGPFRAYWIPPGFYLRLTSDSTSLTTPLTLAVKLEEGTRQTLANQDADGNWVLNDPPPNKALELLKCQRYYRIFSDESRRPTKAVDFCPPMRINPALGTIIIDGKTYYTADAGL